eukprot:CAMPEP_0170122292 /NCGR_PEP_ID=MMETSP0020_2-20130122/16563_1 /TAXON_ID=98059 /ORGANISM="Dinobryon sp., Strain UTEXLB2267" /LENGTH=215 /DNA_ID=CAMNT_0010353143 /DNA_START=296 /DNA_END=940 /DNA_ORIENTATION=+
MDGNRRYGREFCVNELQGHHDGGKTLSSFIDWCMQAGIEMATVFAFSSENWNRPQIEIDTLMNLFAINAARLQQEALAKNIQVRILSTDTSRLPTHVLTALQQLQSSTQHCSGFVANICVSYGARADLCGGVRRLARRLQEGDLSPQALDEQAISDSLATCGCPDPDVLIRTSGEQRLSNFLLWQLAYTELVFVDKLWPQFTQADLQEVLREFRR